MLGADAKISGRLSASRKTVTTGERNSFVRNALYTTLRRVDNGRLNFYPGSGGSC